MNDEELLKAEYDELVSEYHSAKEAYDAVRNERGTAKFDIARRRWTQAQEALVESRRYWRGIGEALGIRDMVVVENERPNP